MSLAARQVKSDDWQERNCREGASFSRETGEGGLKRPDEGDAVRARMRWKKQILKNYHRHRTRLGALIQGYRPTFSRFAGEGFLAPVFHVMGNETFARSVRHEQALLLN